MSTLVDRVAPARLGPGVRRLLAAGWLTQAGDGLALVAGPLAVASLTHAPLAVAGAVALQRLPVLVLGPAAATVADHVNRRTIVVAGNACRVLLLLLVALGLATGALGPGFLLTALVVLGTLEAFVDAAHAAIPAMLAPGGDGLQALHGRLDAGFLAGTQLVGPLAGAGLFLLSPATPWLVQGLLLALAVRAISRIPLAGPSLGGVGRPPRLVLPGLRRIAVQPALSAVVLAGLASHAAWAAVWSLLVLYAGERGIGPVGFALLLVAGAAGGLAGMLLPHSVLARIDPRAVLLGGLALEAAGHVGLAVLEAPAAAYPLVAGLGLVGFVWSAAARGRREELLGDADPLPVAAAVGLLTLAATVAGSLLGGVVAAFGGVDAAYVGAAVLTGAAMLLLARRLTAADRA